MLQLADHKRGLHSFVLGGTRAHLFLASSLSSLPPDPTHRHICLSEDYELNVTYLIFVCMNLLVRSFSNTRVESEENVIFPVPDLRGADLSVKGRE